MITPSWKFIELRRFQRHLLIRKHVVTCIADVRICPKKKLRFFHEFICRKKTASIFDQVNNVDQAEFVFNAKISNAIVLSTLNVLNSNNIIVCF